MSTLALVAIGIPVVVIIVGGLFWWDLNNPPTNTGDHRWFDDERN